MATAYRPAADSGSAAGSGVPATRSVVPAVRPAGPAGRAARRAGGRHRLADVAMFLLASFALVAPPHPLSNGWDGYPHWLRVADAVFGGLALLGIFWRRRFPLAYAVYLVPVSCFATSSGLATLVAVFTVAVHRRWQVAVPVAVVLSATAAPVMLLYPDGAENSFAPLLVGSVAATLAFTAWGMYVRARRQLVASLRERADRAEAEQVLRADRARRAERQRIAREMHDVLAHRLSLLAVHAGALEFRADAPASDVSRAAGVIRSTAHDALEELRDVVAVLRDDDDDSPERPQPTLADLPELVAECRRAGTAISDRVLVDPTPLPRSVGRTVYRIVQEALTNVRKHAPASGVDLSVSGAPDSGLSIVVRSRLAVDRVDDPMPRSGSGLVGLAERAELAGGWLDARADGGDFVVRGWVPWPAEARP